MTLLDDDPLAARPGRPLWLVTLADLALLLLGFMVLVQATTDKGALARGLRDGFGATASAEPPIPLAATAVRFAPGSADLSAPAPLVAWARDALRDPRVTVTVTGGATRDEGPLLATDRVRAVLAALTAAGLPAERLQVSLTTGAPRVTLTLAFAGEPRSQP